MKLKLFFVFILITVPFFAQNKRQTIGFKENKGQIIDQKNKPNPKVKYLLNSGGLNVQLRKNGFSYDIYEIKKHPIQKLRKDNTSQSLLPSHPKEQVLDYSLEYLYHRIDIDFVNSNPNVTLIAEQKSTDYDNYYNVPNKPDGVVMVYQYKQITYKNIYPNIDVVFTVPEDSLKTVEYNFVVHPKGTIADIQMKFSGAKTELVENKISMNVRFGKMEETLPMSWIEDGAKKKEISIGYTKIKKNVYSFESAENLKGKEVIIDPVPTRLWGTYYGGEGFDYSTSVFVKDGFVYWAGITYSSSNIASSGAHQISMESPYGSYDSFFTKLNSDGTRVWGSYYGGNREDKINQIKVSDNENIYIVGSSISDTNISSSSSHQQQKGLYWDGFLAKFDTNGIRQWATFYGGEDNEEAFSLCIDSNEKIYISGETISGNNISTISSHQPNHSNQGHDSYDGFIAKFNSNGVREWGTYYGGNNTDAIFDSKLDSNGNIIFLGITHSSNNISTANAYQEINNGADGFLLKFDPNGNRIWGTYFGGNSNDFFFNLGIDSSDNLYCFGYTLSSSNISTAGVFEEIFKPNQENEDGCIFKFNKNGFKIWGSYFFPGSYGGSVSKKGDIYFTGIVENGFTATPNSFLEFQNSGNETTYLVKFNTNGQRDWSTYFGGNGADYTNVTAVDDDFNVYLAGFTTSLNNIATPNTYQPNLYPDTNFYTPNPGDAFLVKFKDCSSTAKASSNSPICIGNTLELTASGGTNYAWTGPNGFTSTDQNPTIINVPTSYSGQYECNITGTIGECDGNVTVNVIIEDNQKPIPNLLTLPLITGDCQTQVTTIPTATDACTGAIIATTKSSLSYTLPGTYTIIWDYDDGNGNSEHQNQLVTISSQALPVAATPQPFCEQQNPTLNSIAITGQNIKWYDKLTGGTLLADTTLLQNGSSYYASQTINSCESQRIQVTTTIQTTIAPVGNSTQTFCSSQYPTLQTISCIGIAIKWYDELGANLSNTTPLQNGKTYYATQTVNDCESIAKFMVTITLISTLPAINYSESFCDKGNDGTEIVNLSDYNTRLISDVTNYWCSYYSSAIGAENELTTDKITDFSNYKIQLSENEIYVRINSNTPCYAVTKLTLTLIAAPIILIPDVVPICENKNIYIDAGSGFDSYLWSTGEKTPAIMVNNPGTFFVTVTRNNGTISCSATKKFIVKVSTVATITKIETQDWADTENLIRVFVTGEGIYQYSIDGINYQDSNQFSALHSGEYTVTVKDKNGCGIDTEEIYLLMYPKFFTPNEDGFNDTWAIKFSANENNLSVKILDRYGKLITVLNNAQSWNGTLNGQNLPADDYWFVVTRENGKVYKGHFSLKR
jgi:gliding motility-associated-like protein